jgi:hypothetical protein
VTPGEFQGFDWPIPSQITDKLHLTAQGSLAAEAGKAATREIPCQPDAGISVGSWWGERTPDLRDVTEGALVFASAPLDKSHVLVGQPAIHLKAAAEAPSANWSVRLEDVHPDGAVTLVTGGAVNGAQRKSRTEPTPLTPGEFVDLNFNLRFTTYTFAPGHRMRLVVSNAQFPMLWPTPFRKPTKLTVGMGGSTLQLPLVQTAGAPVDFLLKPVNLPVPPDFQLLAGSLGDAPPPSVVRECDWTNVHQNEEQTWKIGDASFLDRESVAYRVNASDPAKAGFRGEGSAVVEKMRRKIDVRTTIDVASDAESFDVTVSRTVSENGTVKGENQWRRTIPRDFP